MGAFGQNAKKWSEVLIAFEAKETYEDRYRVEPDTYLHMR